MSTKIPMVWNRIQNYFFSDNDYNLLQMLPNMIAVDSSMVISNKLWRKAVVRNAASYELTQQLQHCNRLLWDFYEWNLFSVKLMNCQEFSPTHTVYMHAMLDIMEKKQIN